MVKKVNTVGRRIEFDAATYNALDRLAKDRMATNQELADEAFRDFLKSIAGRPRYKRCCRRVFALTLPTINGRFHESERPNGTSGHYARHQPLRLQGRRYVCSHGR